MFELNDTQRAWVAEWFQSSEVQSAIRGKQWKAALVCDSSSGIGCVMVVTIQTADEILSKDITDFESW